MARWKDENWNLTAGTKQRDGTNTVPTLTVQCALLMDLRDELKKLNALLCCHNFIEIPHTLKAIKRNTAKKRRIKK